MLDAKRVLDLLREVEWAARRGDIIYGTERVCPACWNSKREAHKPDCELVTLIAEAEQEAREGGWKPTGVAAKLREKAAEWYAKNSGVGYHVGRAYECAAGMVEAEEDGGWKPGTEPPEDDRLVEITTLAYYSNGQWYSENDCRVPMMYEWRRRRTPPPFPGNPDLQPLLEQSEVKP